MNPQQSININISYNLNAQKKRVAAGRKIQKNHKVSTAPSDIDIKLRRDAEHPSKKHNDNKPPPKHKRLMLRNTPTPQPHLPQRKIKTQSAPYDFLSTHKKNKLLDKTKRRAKRPKSTHIKSCLLEAGRKLDPTDHSQSAVRRTDNSQLAVRRTDHSQSAVRRTDNSQSAVRRTDHSQLAVRRKRTLSSGAVREDKIISRLLNMSLLGSQLGGSQQATSERKRDAPTHNILRQFISSIDMKMIRTMNHDAPPLPLTFSRSHDSIRNILARTSLTLTQLQHHCTVIQRAWRASKRATITAIYRQLFLSVRHKLPTAPKKESFTVEDNEWQDSCDEEDKLSFDHPHKNQRCKWENEVTLPPPLNIAMYKQLVQKSIEEVSHFKEEQIQKWNTIHKKISTIMKDKSTLASNTLLAELVQQSNNNRKLIDFECSGETKEKYTTENNKEQNNISIPPLHLRSLIPQSQPCDSLSQDDDYDKRKYAGQTHQDTAVVTNYLDCGLEGFGFPFVSMDPLEHTMVSLTHTKNDKPIQQDESIGHRFEQWGSLHFEQDTLRNDSDRDSVLSKASETVQFLISFLFEQFAKDISYILKRSSGQPDQKASNNKIPGIQTNFQSVREYVTKLILFITGNPPCMERIGEMINKDLGPTSQDLLKYLRMEEIDEEDEDYEEDGLFVIDTNVFESFQTTLKTQEEKKQGRQLPHSKCVFLNFWHRAIFQSYNECLDYERPYAIEGKPYSWVVQHRAPHYTSPHQLPLKLHHAQERLLSLASYVTGVIFEREDFPFPTAELDAEKKHIINEERLSRMLATELLQSQNTWLIYNDQLVELIVEISRLTQERIFVECSADLRRLQRSRILLQPSNLI